MLWSDFLHKDDVDVSINYERSYELNGEAHEVTGKITRKTTSCGREVLQEDGSVKRGPGVCDGGNSLTVEGVLILTGSGALGGRSPKYISDISELNAGDKVKVLYALDEGGRASTNCEVCYIKKIK